MTDDDLVVLVPAGEPILVAAAWVGTACWAELRLHQMISDRLGTGIVAALPTASEAPASEAPAGGARPGDVAAADVEASGAGGGQSPRPFGGEVDGLASASSLWTVRAHRAEVAESWHRRLPELREFPRHEFVVAGADGERLVAKTDVAVTLQALLDHYRQRMAEPLGPADGPVADTLASVIARTEADLALLTRPV